MLYTRNSHSVIGQLLANKLIKRSDLWLPEAGRGEGKMDKGCQMWKLPIIR